MGTQLLPGLVTQTPGFSGQPAGAAGIGGEVRNFYAASAGQLPVAATRTYIAGTALQISQSGLQVGSLLRWKFNITKTAAGTAASTIDVAMGLTGTAAGDAAVLSFTKPAGTAAVDEGTIELECLVQSIGAAGKIVGEFTLVHNGNTVGHATVPTVLINTTSAAFDTTDAGGFPLTFGLCITTGAADAITIAMVRSEAWYF